MFSRALLIDGDQVTNLHTGQSMTVSKAEQLDLFGAERQGGGG
jgi:hypothetical protein